VIEFATPHTLKESVDLFRIGAREVDANPDGIDFSGPMFEGLRLTGLFTREQSLDPASFPSRTALDLVSQNMQTGMAHLWQVTPTNTRADQIRAGAGLGPRQPRRHGARDRDAAAQPGAAGIPGDGPALRPRARDAGARGRDRANVGTPRLRARRGAEPALATGRKDCRDLTADTAVLFSFFNEVGIIGQLAGSLFERRLPDGFLVSHFGVVNNLVRLGDGKTPLDLARAFQVPKTTMTHTLAGLEKAGFIRFAPNPRRTAGPNA
jgi:hypothetical protein